MTRLVDAHAHFEAPEELPFRRDVLTLFCGTDPDSARRALALAGPGVVPCCGLHPWRADRYAVRDMLPFIEQSPVLGEIGLDSVWCDVDMDLQRAAFEAQLDLAEALERPVVLHVKGMEEEAARRLERRRVRKLAHWYSCEHHLERYIRQDCWFTVGPDWATNPAVKQVIERVPLNRLLTETDGVGALGWALGRKAGPEDIAPALEGELHAIAEARGIAPEEAAAIVGQNLLQFIHGPR